MKRCVITYDLTEGRDSSLNFYKRLEAITPQIKGKMIAELSEELTAYRAYVERSGIECGRNLIE